MQGPEKNSYKEFDNEKKFLRLENSPPPHNFSNGPSLRCFISTVLLTDSCHDHAVIRDLSHYNPLVTLCLPLRDNTIRARVSLNSCLSF